MAGIYIHIPFCRKACHYCNFHFSTTHKHINPLVAAIVDEIFLQKNYTSETIETIYFGGGTPSLLHENHLKQILHAISSNFKIISDPEITLESNPDDFNKENLQAWKKMGINRLSIGVQSFFESDLQWMNRAHHAEQAENCIMLAKAQGFENITIDLIYGTPTLSDEGWLSNVQKALALGVNHLSCYALTVEPKTGLDALIKQKKIEAVDPEKQARHFLLLMDFMENAGWYHYEISNFCKPGNKSKHNSNYWNGNTYLGIGPSAHSFNGNERQWNVANNAIYMNSISDNKIPFEIETLSAFEKLNEYIMTSLRTMEGLSLDRVEKNWGKPIKNELKTLSQKFFDQGWMVEKHNHLVLTKQGKLMADGIASDLFFL